ncbi:methyl-accepting chemotaxis protein [Thermospira aquatica]|uniref:Cache domain-containing protein n=1 Tax=Thermospira aquatica TaxID=2828656 RepID=A0AAX3BCF2_9SPIR|nr:methyl-accepting chemotaxis protein [Thermospira aquatica]URA09927.1 cache domain-containing protein [Thermospira aquatica]
MQRFSLRLQLFVGMITLFIISIGGIGVLNYIMAQQSLQKSLEDHIDSVIDLSYNFLNREIVAISGNYLKGVTFSARHSVSAILQDVKNKKIKEKDAMNLVKRYLFSIPIGKTGYPAILNGKGEVVLHPKLPAGTNLSSFDFIQEALKKKEGIVFYSWKNPGEQQAREKFLYVSYIPEKDWYFCSTAYIDEFSDMVELSSLRGAFKITGDLKDVKVFLMDEHGFILFHPTLSTGTFFSNVVQDGENILTSIVSTGNGFISYTINDTEGKSTPVFAYFKTLKLSSTQWILVAELPKQTIQQLTFQFRLINMTVIVVAFILMLIISFWLTKSIQNSLKNIQTKLENISSGTEKADLSRRIEIQMHNEIGTIASLMNRFLDKINNDLLSVRETSLFLKNATVQSQEIMEKTLKQSLESIKNKVIQIDFSTENATSGIEELTANLEEMSRSIQSIMHNMEQQASAVEESASSIEEMVRNIENITATTMKSQAISTNLNNVAQEGGEAVKKAISSIKEVSEYSQQIRKMLQIISNIAKQTNLLAMNAAIEAAHAGEAGKGFAIVAEEIRRLSEDTNKNAREIGEVINVIVDRIEQSVKLSEKAGIGLDMILTYSQQNNQMINQINLAMSEQNQGAKEILASTHEIVKITEEVKIAITEQNTATQDFGDAVRGLRDLSLENKKIIQDHLNDLNTLLNGIEEIQKILNEVVSHTNSLDHLLGSFILKEKHHGIDAHALEQ